MSNVILNSWLNSIHSIQLFTNKMDVCRSNWNGTWNIRDLGTEKIIHILRWTWTSSSTVHILVTAFSTVAASTWSVNVTVSFVIKLGIRTFLAIICVKYIQNIEFLQKITQYRDKRMQIVSGIIWLELFLLLCFVWPAQIIYCVHKKKSSQNITIRARKWEWECALKCNVGDSKKSFKYLQNKNNVNLIGI